MIKKLSFYLIGLLTISISFSVLIPNVAITFGLADTTARSVVNFIMAASNVVAVVSVIGIVFGVGGFSLAAVQTVKYLARKSFAKAVAW